MKNYNDEAEKEDTEGWEREFWSQFNAAYIRGKGWAELGNEVEAFIRSERQSLADAVLAAVPEQRMTPLQKQYEVAGKNGWNMCRSQIIQALKEQGVEMKDV